MDMLFLMFYVKNLKKSLNITQCDKIRTIIVV